MCSILYSRFDVTLSGDVDVMPGSDPGSVTGPDQGDDCLLQESQLTETFLKSPPDQMGSGSNTRGNSAYLGSFLLQQSIFPTEASVFSCPRSPPARRDAAR